MTTLDGRKVLYGRHTATAAGATEEPDALPLPGWGTFLGVILGSLAAASGVVYAVLFGSDHHWFQLILALLWAVMGGAGACAAARLRRPEWFNPVLVYLGSFDAVAAGIVVATYAHFRHHGGVAGLLVVLGAGTAIGTWFEVANRTRWERDRTT